MQQFGVLLGLLVLLAACSSSDTEQKNKQELTSLNLLIVKQGFPLNYDTVEHVYREQNKQGMYDVHLILREKAAKQLAKISIESLENVMLPVFGDTVISRGNIIKSAVSRSLTLTSYDDATSKRMVQSVRQHVNN